MYIISKVKSDFEKVEKALLTREFILSKLFVFWSLLTFVGLLFTGSSYVSQSANNPNFSIFDALNAQMLRFQLWTIFSLIIIWTSYKFGSKFQKWSQLFPLHLGAGILWSLITTLTFFVFSSFIGNLISSNFSTLSEMFRNNFIPNFVIGIFGYKIILTTNIALDNYKKFELERERSKQLENQLAQAQLQALKMQLQPHFLFNTLNSVSNLTLENPRNAVQMIARLGDFLRLTINSNGTQKVSLEKELKFLKHYLEIEKMRFQDRLKIEFKADENTLSAEVPNLILQPLVENAIKHGISKSMSAGKIRFASEKIEDKLKIQIENDGLRLNGKGFETEGVGIANTKNRLEQLYENDFKFELQPLRNGGAKVILEIPFIEKEKFAHQ